MAATKKARAAWGAKFKAEFTEYLRRAGAVATPRDRREFRLETKAGPLWVTPYEGWLACVFEDAGLARKALEGGFVYRLGTTGKWNFRFTESIPVATCLDMFDEELAAILFAPPAPKMGRWGLAYAGKWRCLSGITHSLRDTAVRPLSNGWELRRAWTNTLAYSVHDDHPTNNYVRGADTIRLAVWRATFTFLLKTFNGIPMRDDFIPWDLDGSPGDWGPFRVWADKLQDEGFDDHARNVRRHLPSGW